MPNEQLENKFEIKIEEQYFLATDEERRKVVDELYSTLNTLKYLPFETTYYGLPYLDSGDMIELLDKEDIPFYSYVFNHTIKYNGAYSGKIVTSKVSNTESKMRNSKDFKSRFRNVEYSVNKIDGQIKQIIEEVTDNSQKIVQTEMDIDTIKDTVISKDEVSEIVEELKRDIDGVTNTLSEKGGNNLIYYDKEFWNSKNNSLPEEYQEVEYIQGTGTQYINTGYVANENTRISLNFKVNGGALIFGSYGMNENGAQFYWLAYEEDSSTDKYFVAYYGTSGQAFENIDISTDIIFDLNRNNLRIQDQEYIFEETNSFPEFPLFLFNLNYFGEPTSEDAGDLTIYSCKIWDNDTLVRNFIPCYRKADGAKGLYDTINYTFYENQGTEEFIIGEEIKSDDSIEEYTDTEIQNNSVSSRGYILNKGHFEQTVQVVNGIYTVSFNYKKLKELATGTVTINGLVYELSELDWTKFSETIEVNSNYITIKFDCDTIKAFYITDLLINLGDMAEVWTQNPNETRTDTVKIGKGIQITSSVKDTKLKADADGIRVVQASNEENIGTEFTDKGTITKYLEAQGGEMAGLLHQKVNYNGSYQTWISSLL